MSATFDRVLLAFGDDEHDASLLLYLREVCLAGGASQVHVVSAKDCDREHADALALRMEQAARAAVRDLPVSISCAVVGGPVLDALVSYATEHRVDVALIGHRRTGPARSLARRLTRAAPCAVWMAPERPPGPIDSVVVAVDFSATGARALDTALAMCRRRGIPNCILVNVVCRLTEPGAHEADAVAKDLARLLEGHDTLGVNVRLIREDADDVATGVARVAALSSAGLVCIGARGRTAAAAILLGSATEDVMDRLPCPVLVVRSPGRPLSLLNVLASRFSGEDDRPRPVA